MTLFQHTLGALLRGEKTEISRLALPESSGETMIGTEALRYPNGIKAVCRGNHMRWTPKWIVGQDYAIQPARGVKSIGRYRINDIWKQDVRTLTDEQITTEGFHNLFEFLLTWTKMHDKSAFTANHKTDFSDGDESGIMPHSQGWVSWIKGTRPDERYTAWRMSITVLWDTVDWDALAVKTLNVNPYVDLVEKLTAEDWYNMNIAP